MKTMNIIFEDTEFEFLLQEKNLAGDTSWREFILNMARRLKE